MFTTVKECLRLSEKLRKLESYSRILSEALNSFRNAHLLVILPCGSYTVLKHYSEMLIMHRFTHFRPAERTGWSNLS